MTKSDIAAITLEGADRLVALLRRLGGDIPAAMEQGAMDAGAILAEEANERARAPVCEVVLEKKKTNQVEVSVGPDKEHWYYRFMETGTTGHDVEPKHKRALAWDEVVVGKVTVSGMAAEPFLRPALDENEERLIQAVADAMLRELDRLAGAG